MPHSIDHSENELLRYLRLVEERSELHSQFRQSLTCVVKPALALKRKDEELKHQEQRLAALRESGEIPRLPRPDPIDWNDGFASWLAKEAHTLELMNLLP